MKVPVVGFSYQDASVPFANDRTINLIPISSEGNSREATMLIGTPGLEEFAEAGYGPVRGMFTAANGRGFLVSGNTFYEVDSTGTATVIAALNTSTGWVTLADNGLELAVCDGEFLYIFTYADDTFVEVTDTDFPGAFTVCEMDGYFIVNVPESGQIYISGLYDGLSWDALEFATAEGFPDNLIRVFSAYGILWLFGDVTTEPWQNTGATDFPFARMSNTRIETGLLAAQTVAAMDNSVFFVGKDRNGSCIVYRMMGSSPVRISTHAIEQKLSELAHPSELKAWTYQKNGRAFYVLTGAELETSLVFDASTKVWHERAYLNNGIFEQHLGADCMFCFGYHLVGDRRSGKIYKLLDNVYTDNGEYIRRQRNFKMPSNENETYTIDELEILFESGTGISTGQGSAPYALLKISNDGGRTYSNEYASAIGAVGNYETRAVWRQLGDASAWDFEVAVSDPVKVAIIGGYVR